MPICPYGYQNLIQTPCHITSQTSHQRIFLSLQSKGQEEFKEYRHLHVFDNDTLFVCVLICLFVCQQSIFLSDNRCSVCAPIKLKLSIAFSHILNFRKIRKYSLHKRIRKLEKSSKPCILSKESSLCPVFLFQRGSNCSVFRIVWGIRIRILSAPR